MADYGKINQLSTELKGCSHAGHKSISWNNHAMYWDDHAPPHFHAKYSEYEITVNILTGVVEGKFPKRALRHVLEWYELHREELIANWELCQNDQPPKTIEPLE